MDQTTYAALISLIAAYLPAWLAPYLPLLPVLWLALVFVKTLVPPPAAGSKWLPFYAAFNVLAGNFWHSANAIPAGLSTSMATPVAIAAAITAALPAQAAMANEAEGVMADIEKARAALPVVLSTVSPAVTITVARPVAPTPVDPASTFIPAAILSSVPPKV